MRKSKLEITRDTLIKRHRLRRTEEEKQRDAADPQYSLVNGIFLPTYSPKARVLLYIRFSYRGLEKIVVYDHQQTAKLVLPDDVI